METGRRQDQSSEPPPPLSLPPPPSLSLLPKSCASTRAGHGEAPSPREGLQSQSRGPSVFSRARFYASGWTWWLCWVVLSGGEEGERFLSF